MRGLSTEGHTQEANLDSVTSKLEPTETADSLPVIPGLGQEEQEFKTTFYMVSLGHP